MVDDSMLGQVTGTIKGLKSTGEGIGKYAAQLYLGEKEVTAKDVGRVSAHLAVAAVTKGVQSKIGLSGIGAVKRKNKLTYSGKVAHTSSSGVTYSSVGKPSAINLRSSGKKGHSRSTTKEPKPVQSKSNRNIREEIEADFDEASQLGVGSGQDPNSSYYSATGEKLTVRNPTKRQSVGQKQGREFRKERLELSEFEQNQPSHVRGWLRQERSRIKGSGGGSKTIRNPKGYVLAHGRKTPAREGFDYSNSRINTSELNKLEERVRRRLKQP